MRRALLLILVLIAAGGAACTAPPTPAVPTRLLAGWQPQQDTLTEPDAARAWRFNGQRGDVIRLHLDAKAGGRVTLTLQDDTGHTLAQGDDLSAMLPASGVFTALVRLVEGAGTTYSLTLTYPNQAVPTVTPTFTPSPTATLTPTATYTPSPTFTPSETPTATYTPTEIYAPLGTLSGRLQNGAAVTGSYLSPFERHIYLFSATAQERVTISMIGTSGTVDPTVTLFDPGGQPMATDANSGGNGATLLRDIRLPVDGDYIVQALGGGTGNYTIRLDVTAPTLNPLTATATAPPGTITPSGGQRDG